MRKRQFKRKPNGPATVGLPQWADIKLPKAERNRARLRWEAQALRDAITRRGLDADVFCSGALRALRGEDVTGPAAGIAGVATTARALILRGKWIAANRHLAALWDAVLPTEIRS